MQVCRTTASCRTSGATYPLLLLNEAVRNDSGIHFDIIKWTEDEDVPYADFVATAWTNFAKTG